MDNLQYKTILAGLFFGIWPLLMNRSGLNGNVSSLVFVAVALVCIIPFVIGNTNNLANINWLLAILAGVIGGFGILAANSMLAKATPQNIGSLLTLMVVIQVTVPAIYEIIMTGRISMLKLFGFVFAIVSGILLIL